MCLRLPASITGLAPAEAVPIGIVPPTASARIGPLRAAAHECIERRGFVYRAKPRGSAPECRVELRPPRHRARRITARVMRSFGRRLPHTLPFQAHPRVRLRSKKPAPAVATFFELRRTLRAGTESVLFPWRCVVGASNVLGGANAAASLRGPKGGLPALAGERPLRPRSPLPGLHPV